MNFSEDQLDMTNSKIIELEKTICILQDNISQLSEHIRETQRYLIKLAHAQAEVTKRVSSWPFIAVDIKGDTK